jgi:hypothetical protein
MTRPRRAPRTPTEERVHRLNVLDDEPWAHYGAATSELEAYDHLAGRDIRCRDVQVWQILA